MTVAYTLYSRADEPALLAFFADPEADGWPSGSSVWEGYDYGYIWLTIGPNSPEWLRTLHMCFATGEEMQERWEEPESRSKWWFPISGYPELVEDLVALLERERADGGPFLKSAILQKKIGLDRYSMKEKKFEKYSEDSWRKMSKEEKDRIADGFIKECKELRDELRRLEREGHEYITLIMG